MEDQALQYTSIKEQWHCNQHLGQGDGEITETLEAINHKPAACLFLGMDRDNLVQPIGLVFLSLK